LVVGLAGLTTGFAAGFGVLVGSGVFSLGLGSVVAPGVRPATTGASLLDWGKEAMRSAMAVSGRVNVSTVAVAIVVTTVATTIL
jgi:hypothetical protein